MQFLIDENLPGSFGNIFKKQSFTVTHVKELSELHGQSDEVIFNYCSSNNCVLITRDIGFTNPTRFNQNKVPGLILIRFPNEISIKNLIREVERLVEGFSEKDYRALIIIEPGLVRKRTIK